MLKITKFSPVFLLATFMLIHIGVAVPIKSVESTPQVNSIPSEIKISFPGPIETKEECKLSPTCKRSSITKFICASDGKTYKNSEEFECFRKSCQKDLTIKSEGKCQDKSQTPNEIRQKKFYDPQQIYHINCNPDECGCPDDFNPVCGSDGITYGNNCLLKCNRKCNPDIVQFHDGYCGKIFFRDSMRIISNGKLLQSSLPRKHAIVYTLTS